MCEGGGARVRQEVIKNRRRGIGHALVEGLAGGRGPSSSHPHTVCLRPTFGYTRGGRGGGGGGSGLSSAVTWCRRALSRVQSRALKRSAGRTHSTGTQDRHTFVALFLSLPLQFPLLPFLDVAIHPLALVHTNGADLLQQRGGEPCVVSIVSR